MDDEVSHGRSRWRHLGWLVPFSRLHRPTQQDDEDEPGDDEDGDADDDEDDAKPKPSRHIHLVVGRFDAVNATIIIIDGAW